MAQADVPGHMLKYLKAEPLGSDARGNLLGADGYRHF